MDETIENRAELVSTNVIFNLARIGSGTLHSSKFESVFEQLPSELTVEEVSRLGLRVSDYTELVAPSPDAIKHGRKNETGMVRELGFMRAVSGDFVTATSASEHLKALKGINNRLAAFLIDQKLKKSTIRENPLQTS